MSAPVVVGTELVTVDECIVFDMTEVDGQGCVIFPNDIHAVKAMEIPVGHFPSRTENGFEVSVAKGFAAARVAPCFKDREVFSDGSCGPVSEWKVGTGA